MTPKAGPPHGLCPVDGLYEVVTHNLGSLPVTQDGKVVGVVCAVDVCSDLAGTAMQAFPESPPT